MKTFRVYFRPRNHTFANWKLVSETELAEMREKEKAGELEITSARQVDNLGRVIPDTKEAK